MAQRAVSRFIANYGMGFVLLLLCAYYAWATLQRQPLTGDPAAKACAVQILKGQTTPTGVLIIAGVASGDQTFASALSRRLRAAGVGMVDTVGGEPRLARQALQSMLAAGRPPTAIAATEDCASWLPGILAQMPAMATTPLITPGSQLWPTFLQADNLLNVANQIVVIAIIAVGMTLVIISGGIDLSVGSLVALAAVVAGVLIRDRAGGERATTLGLIGCSLAAITAAGAIGAFSGLMIAFFRIPPFIATLGMMQVASGLAYILAAGQSIYDIPQSFVWLGRGATLGMSNSVSLMAFVYLIAYLVMSRTRFGRYVYAVGGNAEAARLSGVRVGWILMAVYIISGVAAGIGGVVVASQLKSSSPTYGLSYELYVIAAVVLGGTSLAGGSGKVIGTLIGALMIAVIQNGMNLTGVESYRQKVVLGFVILGAVLLDTLKKRPWQMPHWLRPKPPRDTPAATVSERSGVAAAPPIVPN
jgi:ribose transport system permease protein